MATQVMCKAVHNIKFSSYSREALTRIGDQLSNAQIGSLLLVSSTFHSVFTKASSTIEIGINVGMADWEGIAKASGDWPNAVKQMIARDARNMEISTSGQESVFWGELARCLKGY